MKNLIDIKGLAVDYFTSSGPVPAVRGVDIVLNKGEVIGIVGESGCGKSTIASAVMDIIGPEEGKISADQIMFYDEKNGKDVDLQNISDEEMRQIRGNEISLVMQDPYNSLNPVIKIGKQLEEAVVTHNNYSQDKCFEIIKNRLYDVNLAQDESILNAFPHQLSGGMLQRVNIAMALLNDPKILIADEPTSNLDVTIQKMIIYNMIKLKKDLDLSMIFITHNLNLVSEFADRLYVLYAGKIVEYGPSKEVFSNPIHPYTRGLINTLTGFVRHHRRIYPIPGNVPNPQALPEGCAFAPRCKVAMVEQCMQKESLIEIKERAPGHYVRCIWT